MRAARRLWDSPLRWGVLYLALVPMFTTVYASLPARSFHDADIQFEAPLANDAARLISALSEAVGAQHRTPTWDTPLGPLELEPGTIRIAHIRHTQDGRLLLELAGRYASVSGHEPAVVGSFGEWVEVDVEDQFVTEAPGEAPQVGYPVALVNPNGGAAPHVSFYPPVSLLLPSQGAAGSLPSDTGFLTMAVATANKLTRFYNAAEGDPSYASGLWLRMLYFSSTTITTLGLGDVTPISSTARSLVGFESLAGIVVIGLFLNALAGRLRRSHCADRPASGP